jgi:hypothetical protein
MVLNLKRNYEHNILSILYIYMPLVEIQSVRTRLCRSAGHVMRILWCIKLYNTQILL